MIELKNGDKCYVSDINEKDALLEKITRTFIGKFKYYYIVADDEGSLEEWTTIATIPEAKVMPWTFETCPLPPFTVMSMDGKGVSTVTQMDGLGVFMGDTRFTWEELLSVWNYIPDRNNRDETLPCGEVK